MGKSGTRPLAGIDFICQGVYFWIVYKTIRPGLSGDNRIWLQPNARRRRRGENVETPTRRPIRLATASSPTTRPSCGAWPTPCGAAWTPPSTSMLFSVWFSSSISPTPLRRRVSIWRLSVRQVQILRIRTSTAARAFSGCRPRRVGRSYNPRRACPPLAKPWTTP